MIGKWHLGDLWPKTNLHGKGNKGYGGNFSSPTQHGFDEWLMTQAEASNSMPNCGCFPVNHSRPVGPLPIEPNTGPVPGINKTLPNCCHDLTPHGNQVLDHQMKHVLSVL
eukprot:SAG31_NODE_3642_length_4032_cov_1.536232_5_plen_110_part_00